MDTMTIIKSMSPSSWTDLSLCGCDKERKVQTRNTPPIEEEKEVFVNYFDGAPQRKAQGGGIQGPRWHGLYKTRSPDLKHILDPRLYTHIWCHPCSQKGYSLMTQYTGVRR